MKMKLAALAVCGIALTPLAAFAQSAPAPINQTGPGVTPPVSSSTDMGIVSESGNTSAWPGGIYTGGPRAALVAPSRSYAVVPSSGYYAAPAYDAYGPYSGATVGYGEVDID